MPKISPCAMYDLAYSLSVNAKSNGDFRIGRRQNKWWESIISS